MLIYDLGFSFLYNYGIGRVVASNHRSPCHDTVISYVCTTQNQGIRPNPNVAANGNGAGLEFHGTYPPLFLYNHDLGRILIHSVRALHDFLSQSNRKL